MPRGNFYDFSPKQKVNTWLCLLLIVSLSYLVIIDYVKVKAGIIDDSLAAQDASLNE